MHPESLTWSVTGRGPKTGWVSIKVSGKDLLVRLEPEIPSTCEATSENEEPPELVAQDDDDEEVLSVESEEHTSKEQSRREMESHGRSAVPFEVPDRVRGAQNGNDGRFSLQRGRLSKEWLKKDFELRPNGYAMMRRPVENSLSAAVAMARQPLSRPNVPVMTALPHPRMI
eukprot:g9084.t1